MLLAIYLYDAVLVCAHIVVLVLYCSSAELSGGPAVYMQVHIDKYSPQGGRIVCATVVLIFITLLPHHLGSHTPSLGDWSPFVEGGCCYARS